MSSRAQIFTAAGRELAAQLPGPAPSLPASCPRGRCWADAQPTRVGKKAAGDLLGCVRVSGGGLLLSAPGSPMTQNRVGQSARGVRGPGK